MIDIHNLRKSYGPIVAVDDLSLTIHPGQTFGLLGPNGAGKTTLIHLLTGALRPDSGSIQFLGRAGPGDRTIRQQIGLAPQAFAVYDGLTGAENLAFFGQMYGLAGTRLRERIDWALELAGLTDRRQHRAGTYSGGMKRRLNFACALVHDPAVIFLDEPTAGVDPQSRSHLLEAVGRLAAQGRTIVYTSHYLEEAQKLCQRVAVMDHGKFLAVDGVDQLIERYGGRSVIEARLAGTPPGPIPGLTDGNRLRLEAEQPVEEVARLSASGVRFQHVQISRPNLETVFLTLTGRSLRD